MFSPVLLQAVSARLRCGGGWQGGAPQGLFQSEPAGSGSRGSCPKSHQRSTAWLRTGAWAALCPSVLCPTHLVPSTYDGECLCLEEMGKYGVGQDGWTPWQAWWSLFSWGLKGGMRCAHEFGGCLFLSLGCLFLSLGVLRLWLTEMDREHICEKISKNGQAREDGRSRLQWLCSAGNSMMSEGE